MSGREPWFAALRAKAELAQRGPWRARKRDDRHIGTIYAYCVENRSIREGESIAQTMLKHDAEFVAAASPSAVLALLDIAEAAAELVAELDEDVKTWGGDHLPESTEDARRATADALSRPSNSHKEPK